MSGGALLLIVVSGALAGAINAAVGSGTLLTYPVLVSLGIPPVVANGTNALGMVPGSISGAFAYRRELVGRKTELIRWSIVTGCGAIVGALLVVLLPARAFTVLVPWLILLACVLIAIGPLVTTVLAKRRSSVLLTPALGGIGVYGGYFGAGQGVAYLAALGSLDGADMHRCNAVKNVLATVANTTAGVTFALAGFVEWKPAVLLAVGTLAGGALGGNAARRLPQGALRIIIVIIGIAAAAISFLAM